jgi:hypothetical protein
MSVFDAERQHIIARSLDKLRHFIVCKLGPVTAANVYAGGIPDRPGQASGYRITLLVRYSGTDRSCVG